MVDKVSSSKKSTTSSKPKPKPPAPKPASSSSPSKSSSPSSSSSSSSGASPSSASKSATQARSTTSTTDARSTTAARESDSSAPPRRLNDSFEQSAELREEDASKKARGLDAFSRRLTENYGEPGSLTSQSKLKGSELDKVESWQDALTTPDRNWYQNYLNGIEPQDRDQALRAFTKINDGGVSDPQERSRLRRSALDEAMQLDDSQARHLQGIDLSDRGGNGYDAMKNRLSLDTSILDKPRSERNQAVSNQMDKLRADHAQAANTEGRQGRELAHGMNLGAGYRDALSKPEAHKELLNDLYRQRGYQPDEAKERADGSLKNREAFHNNFRDGYLKASPEDQERMKALNPQMADLMTRYQPKNEDFMKNLDLGKVEKQQGLKPGQLKRFHGFEEDPGKADKLQNWLHKQAGLEPPGTANKTEEVRPGLVEPRQATDRGAHARRTEPGQGTRPEQGNGTPSTQPAPGTQQGGGTTQPAPGTQQGGGTTQPAPGTPQGGGTTQPAPGTRQGGGTTQPAPGIRQGGGTTQPDPGTQQGGGTTQPAPGTQQGGGTTEPAPGTQQGGGTTQPAPGTQQGGGTTHPAPGTQTTRQAPAEEGVVRDNLVRESMGQFAPRTLSPGLASGEGQTRSEALTANRTITATRSKTGSAGVTNPDSASLSNTTRSRQAAAGPRPTANGGSRPTSVGSEPNPAARPGEIDMKPYIGNTAVDPAPTPASAGLGTPAGLEHPFRPQQLWEASPERLSRAVTEGPDQPRPGLTGARQESPQPQKPASLEGVAQAPQTPAARPAASQRGVEAPTRTASGDARATERDENLREQSAAAQAQRLTAAPARAPEAERISGVTESPGKVAGKTGATQKLDVARADAPKKADEARKGDGARRADAPKNADEARKADQP
ncbi:hypothetical protein DYH09_14690, partial [bacterium CPR1]|nr:hypothetical protein [bacterium CPR1]